MPVKAAANTSKENVVPNRMDLFMNDMATSCDRKDADDKVLKKLTAADYSEGRCKMQRKIRVIRPDSPGFGLTQTAMAGMVCRNIRIFSSDAEEVNGRPFDLMLTHSIDSFF
jgi:hypothetical protein